MDGECGNNDKSHFAGTEQQLRKRTPEEVRLQTASENRQRDDADVTWRGRSFQVRVAAATGKARPGHPSAGRSNEYW